MPQSELSVSIKGSDTLSPALQKVNATLERSRIALNASGAVADDFSKRIQKLHEQYALGEIGASRYDKALKRLEREFQQATAAAQQFSNNTAAATGTTNAIVTANNNATRSATRLVFGINTMSMAMQGGRVSAQGLVGALTALGIGSGPFLVITAGLAVIAGWLLQIENHGDKAAEAIEQATDRARNRMSSLDNEGRLRGNIARLERKQRGEVDNYLGPVADEAERLLAGLPARASATLPTRTSGSLTAEESAELNAARIRLRELERARLGRGSRSSGNARIDWGEDVNFGRFNPTAIDARSDARAAGRMAALGAQDDMLFPGLERSALASLVTDLDPISAAITEINRNLRESAEGWGVFGDAAGSALGAAIDAASAGSNVLKAFFDAGLKSLQKEATVKAVFYAAEAVGRALRGDGAGAAKAGQAAAMYTGAALAIGALAGGGGGRGGAGGGGGSSSGGGLQRTGDAGRDARAITYIQFVTPDGREVSRYVAETNAREARLGAHVARFPLNGIVLDGPVSRAGV